MRVLSPTKYENTPGLWVTVTKPGYCPRAAMRRVFGDPWERVIRLEQAPKNGLWQVWYGSSEPLRQEATADTGSVVRGCPSLSGGRGKARILSGVWEREAGKVV